MQPKVGKDILSFQTSEPPVIFYTGKKDYPSRVLGVLEESERPLNVDEIRRLTGIKSWITTKCVAMDLVLSGKVEVYKSGKQFMFRIKKETSTSSGKVKVTLEENKLVFRTVVNGKNMKATLPLPHIHSYLRKSDKDIVTNFKKVFGVKVNVNKLRQEIAKLLN